jgi:hypothetical protein
MWISWVSIKVEIIVLINSWSHTTSYHTTYHIPLKWPLINIPFPYGHKIYIKKPTKEKVVHESMLGKVITSQHSSPWSLHYPKWKVCVAQLPASRGAFLSNTHDAQTLRLDINGDSRFGVGKPSTCGQWSITQHLIFTPSCPRSGYRWPLHHPVDSSTKWMGLCSCSTHHGPTHMGSISHGQLCCIGYEA